MNRFSGSGITQQMYTRQRRGVYRSTEGFDTVAKSESLDNNFVKKILHPFCLYDAPAELSARGEKNEEVYPAALHLFHTETNDTVIGQSRYLAADFTGQRSAFLPITLLCRRSALKRLWSNTGTGCMRILRSAMKASLAGPYRSWTIFLYSSEKAGLIR